ncbi:hypothetical protein JCM8097_002729 [Rhodosporidiobolus ruineniae]
MHVSSVPHLPTVRVAACNVAPVYLDTAATVKKVIRLIKETAEGGADLVVFPETYVPGFPLWSALASPILNHDLFCQLAEQSIFVDGPEVDEIRAACAQHKVFASVGFNERSRTSLGCIWNAQILISDQGTILNHHRKIAPTFYEKLSWAPGDGSGLNVVDTRLGRIGGLICGENGNPLARFTLASQGEQLHISSWPPTFPTRPPGDASGFNLMEATKIRVQALSFEGKCFSVACSSFMDKAMRDYLVERDPSCADLLDHFTQSGSFFVNSAGSLIGDEIVAKEGVIYCDMDLSKCVEPKQMHDFVGGYNRFDIFNLQVNRTRQQPVTFQDTSPLSSIPAPADSSPAAPRSAPPASSTSSSRSGSRTQASTASAAAGCYPRKVHNFACETCKAKKLCLRLNTACLYRSAPSLKYADLLEARVHELETLVEQLKASDEPTRSKLLQDHDRSSGRRRLKRVAASVPSSEEGAGEERVMEEKDRIRVEMARLAEDSSNRRALHGPSSLFYLIGPSTPDSTGSSPSSSRWLSDSLDSQYRQTVEWLALMRITAEVPEVSAETILAFLSLHWTWVQPFFGYVYRGPFMRDMSTPAPSSSYFSVFLLFAICAHVGRSGLNDFDSVKLTSPPSTASNPHESFNPFLGQARLLLWQEVEKGVSVSTIQGLLLLSAKECFDGRVGQSWTYTGMAIRMVQDLGIHLDRRRADAGDDLFSEELEVRRRVFWAVYLWERWISLYFGRTPMLRLTKDSPQRLFLDMSDETELWTPIGTPLEHSFTPVPNHGVSCFSNSCGLSEIIGLVLEYDAQELDHAALARGKAQLEDWRSNLPAHLRLNPESLPQPAPPSHITNLNCAYFMVTILIYRRLIPHSSKTAGEEMSASLLPCAFAIYRLAHMSFTYFGDRRAVLSHCYSMYTAATTFLQVLKRRDTSAYPTAEEADIARALSWLMVRLEQASLSGAALKRPVAVLKEHLKDLQAPPVHPLQLLVATQGVVPPPPTSSALASSLLPDPSLVLPSLFGLADAAATAPDHGRFSFAAAPEAGVSAALLPEIAAQDDLSWLFGGGELDAALQPHTRTLGTSPALSTVTSFANAILHGSEEAKAESNAQHSALVGRNKFIHEFQHHKVLPQHVETYKQRIAAYYKGIHDSPEFDARLTGSWEIVVGEVDTFVHVFEYEGLAGFEKTKRMIRESEGHLEFFNHEILPLIQSRTSQLNREFNFWQTSPPAEKGGIYELRSYQLHPGALLEWEQFWRQGLEARVNSGHYPVGAFFSQIGPLHQVHHIWQYDSLEARAERRSRSWTQDAWSETVSKTTRLTTEMKCNILKPLPFSPLR